MIHELVIYKHYLLVIYAGENLIKLVVYKVYQISDVSLVQRVSSTTGREMKA